MDLGLAGLLVAIIFGVLAFPTLSRIAKRKALPKALKISFTPQLELASQPEEGILLDYMPGKPISYYVDKSLIVNRSDSVSIMIENIAELGTVEVANYAVVKIHKCLPIPDLVVEFSIPKDGIGGGGTTRYYHGVVLADEEMSRAVACNSDFNFSDFLNSGVLPTASDYSYITLAPNEIEEIIISMNFEPGFYYEYSIGLPYRADGNYYELWSDSIFRTISTRRVLLHKPDGIIPYAEGYDFGPLPEDYKQRPLVPYIEQFYNGVPSDNFDKSKYTLLKRKIESLKAGRFTEPRNYPKYLDKHSITSERFDSDYLRGHQSSSC